MKETLAISQNSLEVAEADLIKVTEGDPDLISRKINMHIFQAHFAAPYIVAQFGIPVFDIQLAKNMGVCLDQVSIFALYLLENLDARQHIEKPQNKPHVNPVAFEKSGMSWGERFYRESVGKSLIYMRQEEVSTLDLRRVYRVVPNLTRAKIDLRRDSHDSFWSEYEVFLNRYQVGSKGLEPLTSFTSRTRSTN